MAVVPLDLEPGYEPQSLVHLKERQFAFVASESLTNETEIRTVVFDEKWKARLIDRKPLDSLATSLAYASSTKVLMATGAENSPKLRFFKTEFRSCPP